MAQLHITHGGIDRIEAVSSLLGCVFQEDPFISYVFLELSEEQRISYLETYFRRGVKAAALHGAIITEANNWEAAAVLVPPGKSWKDFGTLWTAGMLGVMYQIGFFGCWRLMTDVAPQADTAMKKGFDGKEPYYYYLFAIGTKHEYQGKGLGKAIIKNYQEMAQKDNVPIWLEASSRQSHDMYLRYGFEDVETLHLGKGKVSAEGKRESGGAGVFVWAMIWKPR